MAVVQDAGSRHGGVRAQFDLLSPVEDSARVYRMTVKMSDGRTATADAEGVLGSFRAALDVALGSP